MCSTPHIKYSSYYYIHQYYIHRESINPNIASFTELKESNDWRKHNDSTSRIANHEHVEVRSICVRSALITIFSPASVFSPFPRRYVSASWNVDGRTRYMGQDTFPVSTYIHTSIPYVHCYLSICNEPAEWNFKNAHLHE